MFLLLWLWSRGHTQSKQAFKRPEGAYAGSVGRPDQTSRSIDFSLIPTHPLVEISKGLISSH